MGTVSFSRLSRRDFVKATAAAGGAAMLSGIGSHTIGAAPPSVASRSRIETFDYHGVTLGHSRWQRQYEMARDFYFGVSNDDILHGFRRAARLPAPGQVLGGWQSRDSGGVFGQWLSGMSRMQRSLGDNALREKCVYLADEWAKTIPADGNCRMRHYPFEKLIGGLVDLKLNADYDSGVRLMKKVTDWAAGACPGNSTPERPLNGTPYPRTSIELLS
jgi:hypothetical protein